MGYMRHHSIAVSSWKEEDLIKVHKQAVEIFGVLVTPIIYSDINRYCSFFVAPDGSKEGWDESDKYDEKRKEFVKLIDSYKYEDGSNCISFCEFYWADDNNKSEVINYN